MICAAPGQPGYPERAARPLADGRRAARQRRLRPPAPQLPSDAAATADLDDDSLVAVIVAGDHEAMAVLYERYGRICYRLAHQVTANSALAEDAVQEAFLGLWRSPQSYRAGRGSLRTWLLSLAHHKAVDLVRRETAEQRRQSAEARQQAASPPVGADPAAVTWRELQGAEVRSALRELPESQRQAVTLAYFGGYTQTQIADLTGVPLGTVKTRTFHAMTRLRQRLAALAIHGEEGPA